MQQMDLSSFCLCPSLQTRTRGPEEGEREKYKPRLGLRLGLELTGEGRRKARMTMRTGRRRENQHHYSGWEGSERVKGKSSWSWYACTPRVSGARAAPASHSQKKQSFLSPRPEPPRTSLRLGAHPWDQRATLRVSCVGADCKFTWNLRSSHCTRILLPRKRDKKKRRKDAHLLHLIISASRSWG